MRFFNKEISQIKNHLHSLLAKEITRVGVQTPKKHGSYWHVSHDGFEYKLDDYSKAIHVNGFYYGMSFGGFESRVDVNTYRYHLGNLLKKRLRS